MLQLTKDETDQLEIIRKAKLEILFTARDTDGNFLVYNKGQLYLRQEDEDKNRRIGDLYYINNIILYSKWEKEKDVFQKTDSWSIPLLIAKNVDIIWFKTSKRNYWIHHDTIKTLLEKKEALIMKFNSMEKKVYIPRKYWSSDSIIKEDTNYLTLLGTNLISKPKVDKNKYSNRVGTAWSNVLHDYFETPEMKAVGRGLYAARQKGTTIYPEAKDIFRAFRRTPYDQVKVVIIGQDPYNDGSANGLAFDCSEKASLTPSMSKILEAYTEQFPNHFSTDIMSGDLKNWTRQGVLLLNTALTVRKGDPGSHLKHWSPFIQKVISVLNKKYNDTKIPIVYMLLGKQAQQYKTLLNDKQPVIEIEHPVAASYANRKWKHKNCFIKANLILEELNLKTINW